MPQPRELLVNCKFNRNTSRTRKCSTKVLHTCDSFPYFVSGDSPPHYASMIARRCGLFRSIPSRFVSFSLTMWHSNAYPQLHGSWRQRIKMNYTWMNLVRRGSGIVCLFTEMACLFDLKRALTSMYAPSPHCTIL